MAIGLKIGDRIKYLMDRADINPYHLSIETKITQGSIGYWLKGKKEPSKAYILLLAYYFNIEYSWLETGNGDTPQVNTYRDKIEPTKKTLQYIQPNELMTIDDSPKCENCKKLNGKIESLQEQLSERNGKIDMLNQELGRLKQYPSDAKNEDVRCG